MLTAPACLRARVGLACVCDALGQTESAIEHLERAHRDHPDDATVLFALGYCHEKQARLDQAVADHGKVFHAGTRMEDGEIVTAGGRVLCVVALADTIDEAQRRAYALTEKINWKDAFYRRDIGHRALAR